MQARAAIGALLLVCAAVAAGLVPIQHAGAQRATEAAAVVPTVAPLGTTRAGVPWATGEYLEYDVKFNSITAGLGRIQVVGLDTVRGRTAWKLQFALTGGIPFYRVSDSYYSWIDTATLSSLRFVQQLSEGNYHPTRIFEIFPERGIFQQNGKPEQKSVAQPLDDASFFFFIRTIPLEVGKSYEFNRYFNPEGNPVIVRVLRKERIRVPAGTYDAIVIQPIIRTKGIFSQDGMAELWLSDDPRHMLLQMKSKFSFVTLGLFLKKSTLPPLGPESGR